MTARAAATLVLVLATTSSVARADEETVRETPAAPVTFELGARVGVGAPVGGGIRGGGPLARSIGVDVPFGLEAGVRLLDAHLQLGAIASVAPLLVRDCVGEDARCRGHQLDLGALVSWHFTPHRSASPWIGLGVGYERLDLLYAEAGSAIDLVANGGTLGVHAGFDVRMSEHLRVGPVVSGTFGRYTTIALDGVSTRDFEPAVHGWIVFALRATFEP